MSYLDALSGAGQGPTAPPSPASPGMGTPPPMPGMLPPPTGKGPIPTGGSASTFDTAAGDAISSLKNLTGFFPELGGQITALIADIKGKAKAKAQNRGPAIGQPGTPGSAQLDGSAVMDSGSVGPM
jgi:hypothetical protein